MLAGAGLSARVRAAAQALADQPPQDAAALVKRIEARTNHDVKAVEYYVREVLQARRRHGRESRAGAFRLHLGGHQQPELCEAAGRRAQS